MSKLSLNLVWLKILKNLERSVWGINSPRERLEPRPHWLLSKTPGAPWWWGKVLPSHRRCSGLVSPRWCLSLFPLWVSCWPLELKDSCSVLCQPLRVLFSPRGSSWLLKNYPPSCLCLLILQRMLEESPSGHQGGGTCSRPAGLTRVPSNRETQASKPSTCPLTFWYMLSHTCCHETASPPKGSEPGPLHPAGISRLIEHPLLWQPCLGKGELEQFPSVPHRQKGRPLLTW